MEWWKNVVDNFKLTFLHKCPECGGHVEYRVIEHFGEQMDVYFCEKCFKEFEIY